MAKKKTLEFAEKKNNKKNKQTKQQQTIHKIYFKVVTFLQLLRRFFQIQNAL